MKCQFYQGFQSFLSLVIFELDFVESRKWLQVFLGFIQIGMDGVVGGRVLRILVYLIRVVLLLNDLYIKIYYIIVIKIIFLFRLLVNYQWILNY